MNNSDFEKSIQYEFKNKALLEKALTHSSYCRENGLSSRDSNERLEFLGDAYLDAITATELYQRQQRVGEGKLTRIRAMIVCEQSLARIGTRLSIGNYLNMGRGEEHCGGRERESIIADAVEAVIGAFFLDGGYAEAERFILREFEKTIQAALEGKLFSDYKTQIQELLQQKGAMPDIQYILDGEEGPDHDKTFFIHLEWNGKALGSGKGKSKKEAEQNAAKASLDGGYF